MRISAAISAGLGLVMMAAVPAAAMDAKIYPYHTHENYCPAGLQPVTLGGVICCGTPNQSHTYQAMMSHPVAKKKVHKVKSRKTYKAVDCPIGTKGCAYD